MSPFLDLAEGRADPPGGKAKGLALLLKAGLPVPKAVVLPVSGLDADRETITAGKAGENTNLTDATLKAMEHLGCASFAVRSSALDEDTPSSSAAGRYYSALDVRGLEEIVRQVRLCIRSMRLHDTAAREAGVIIQEYKPAELAGVMFTRNPVSGAEEIVVEVVRGTAEKLMQGASSPTTYVIRSNRFEVLKSPDGSSERAGHSDRLAPDQLEVLWYAAHRAKSEAGRDLDIEWLFSGGDLFLVQARPIVDTGRKNRPGRKTTPTYPGMDVPRTGRFSRAFGDQLWHGPVTPMMFDLVGSAIERAMIREPMKYGLGIEPQGPCLCLYMGRVYVALEPIDEVVSLIPEKILSSGFYSELTGTPHPHERPGFEPLAAIFALARLVRAGKPLSPGRALKAFQELGEPEPSVDPAELQDPESAISSLLGELNRFLSTAAWVIGWAYLSESAARAVFGTRIHDYLAAETSTSRLERDFRRLAASWATASPSERALAGEVLSSFPRCNDEGLTGPAKEMARFLGLHGHRALARDLFWPRLGEEPALIQALLETIRLKESHRRDRPTCSEARSYSRRIVSHLLSLVSKLIESREDMRRRADAYLFRLRQICLAQGRRLQACGYLDRPKDVFFLTREEAFEDRGRQRGAMKRAVRMRRRLFKEYGRVQAPILLRDGKPVFGREALPPKTGSSSELRGTPASPGIARGRAKKVDEFAELLGLEQGEVLVAKAADPLWALVFGRCSAVVTELGGTLSHAAVAAREQGIPAVVGVDDLMDTVADGDYLTVDAFKGEVRVRSVVRRK